MAIPEFNQYGVLPEGIYPATSLEVEARYCANPNRQQIWADFRRFCGKELQPQNWSNIVFIDGGFTSDKPFTKDIDVILDMTSVSLELVLDAYGWQVRHHDRIKAAFRTDFWIYHPKLPLNLTQFFQYIKEEERIERGAPIGEKKGLLRLEL